MLSLFLGHSPFADCFVKRFSVLIFLYNFGRCFHMLLFLFPLHSFASSEQYWYSWCVLHPFSRCSICFQLLVQSSIIVPGLQLCATLCMWALTQYSFTNVRDQQYLAIWKFGFWFQFFIVSFLLWWGPGRSGWFSVNFFGLVPSFLLFS